MAYKTKFTPTNKHKYVGDANKIICRSLWERNICKFCDLTENVVKWSFEEIIVPYINPLDKKQHNYFPDFIIQFKNSDGLQTWIINSAKWEAAKRYCDKNNMEFKLITEKEIFAK